MLRMRPSLSYEFSMVLGDRRLFYGPPHRSCNLKATQMDHRLVQPESGGKSAHGIIHLR
ncbi:MAG: hypothetical protein K0R23_1453 [Lacrimispora sp.]|nr:hypothetical protein [Lacrimispora sp.]